MEHVRANFSDAIESWFDATHSLYKGYERTAIDSCVYTEIDSMDKNMFTKDEVKAIVKGAAERAITIEKSLKQSRSSRAGTAFEVIVGNLLRDLGIPCESVTRGDKKARLRRIDLVIPNKATAAKTPDKAHFLSLKTSLRERWNQVVAEQSQGQRTHLLTLLQNEILSNEVARKITDSGIFLYVPDRVKMDRFPNNNGVRRLSSLPSVVE